MNMWIVQKSKYKQVEGLEVILSNIYKNMDSCMVKRPSSVDKYISQIRDTIVEIEKSYGVLGSLLRCGPRQTFFSGQLIRFADLYSHTCLNLLYYPFFYLFRAAATLMPHEATIDLKEKAMSMDTTTSISEAQIKRNAPFLKDTKQLTLCAEEMNLNDSTDSGENFANFED
uniref:Cytosolic purine 5'-nucleotidase (Trinotate prediction) n=1 Tax=Myxobolus squamalis TaxID=59785 RepID=A0A6B2FVM0_MYXSQ